MATTIESMAPAMPGAYFFQHDQFRPNSRSQNIFQPPAYSPTPSRRGSQIPRPVSRSSQSNSHRKRPRLDTNTSYFSRPTRPTTNHESSVTTPFSAVSSYDHVAYNDLDSSTHSFENRSLRSPTPLANSEYRLAGGLDTPGTWWEKGLDELAHEEAAKDYRYNRYTNANTSRTTLSASDSSTFNCQSPTRPLSSSVNSNNKRTRSTKSPTRDSSSLTGWGIRRTAWALTGGLAGRVFNFCVNTAFKGFNAGGGDVYQAGANPSSVNHSTTAQIDSGYYETPDTYKSPNIASKSTYDLSGVVEDYMNSPESRRDYFDGTPRVLYSQLNVCNGDGSAIKNDWQIIDQISLTESGDERSPVRKRSRASVAGGWQRSESQNSNGFMNTKASYASPRAESAGGISSHPRIGGIGASQSGHRTRPSLAHHRRSQSSILTSVGYGSGKASPNRPSSSASMRQYQASNNHQRPESGSGLSPETMIYKRKLQQRDKAQDASFGRLNAQLIDMIREGKEALGSKIEILDDYSGHGIAGAVSVGNDFDEGYYEDGWK